MDGTMTTQDWIGVISCLGGLAAVLALIGVAIWLVVRR